MRDRSLRRAEVHRLAAALHRLRGEAPGDIFELGTRGSALHSITEAVLDSKSGSDADSESDEAVRPSPTRAAKKARREKRAAKKAAKGAAAAQGKKRMEDMGRQARATKRGINGAQ